MFFSLFILFNLLCLGYPFFRLQGHNISYFWILPPVGGEWDSFWWVELDLVSLMGSVTSIVAFWGVCELIMALGDLSINGWDFLFLFCYGMRHQVLELVE